ncbi:MAG: carboxymuconolactone decarboxylase family protein [Candidatus Methylomirabilia bacterium]
MARVPYLERDEIPAELQTVYEATQKAVGRVPNFYKLLAHAPKVLTGYVGLSGALKETKLDPKLRELAYLKTSKVNDCHY